MLPPAYCRPWEEVGDYWPLICREKWGEVKLLWAGGHYFGPSNHWHMVESTELRLLWFRHLFECDFKRFTALFTWICEAILEGPNHYCTRLFHPYIMLCWSDGNCSYVNDIGISWQLLTPFFNPFRGSFLMV